MGVRRDQWQKHFGEAELYHFLDSCGISGRAWWDIVESRIHYLRHAMDGWKLAVEVTPREIQLSATK